MLKNVNHINHINHEASHYMIQALSMTDEGTTPLVTSIAC